MLMTDKAQTNLQLSAITLKEIDYAGPTVLRVSYLLNCVKVSNMLQYTTETNAQEDYNKLVELIGGKATFLSE